MKVNSIEEYIKILTDYMLEINKNIQDTEEWVNTGADEEMYHAIKNVLEYLNKLEEENKELQKKECDFEYMKETIDKQQTQIRELIDKNEVVDLDYKKEYYKLEKENYNLKKKIEEYQEALLNICSK